MQMIKNRGSINTHIVLISPHWFDRDTHQLNKETETSSVHQWRAIP